MLFLKSILLILKSGTKFNEIDILSREELEDEVIILFVVSENYLQGKISNVRYKFSALFVTSLGT